MMSYSEPLTNCIVAISVSSSPDLAPLGMSDAHLRDAAAEFARHLLALGARVAYGGDLRSGGFTEILFELVARHRRDADDGDDRAGVINYLAWPAHLSETDADLANYAELVQGIATLQLLNQDGSNMRRTERTKFESREPTTQEWAKGLTAMRRRMLTDTHARIVAGGQTEGYKGIMPGVAEEAALSLRHQQPLYILGGFGGCARDIAIGIGLMERNGTIRREWDGLEHFEDVTVDALANGLTSKENETLAHTQHVDQATALILRGLIRLSNEAGSSTQAHSASFL